MAVDATTICSNAVLMLGGKTINDLYVQVEDRAVLAASLYPMVRDAVLRSHPWNCACARVALAPDVTAPAFDWASQFTLPGDWIRTLSVGQKGLPDAYVTEGRKILSDVSVLYLRYIFRNDNESTWDTMLAEAMVLAMKAVIAYPITLSQAVATQAAADFENFVRRARAIDGQDDPPETLGDFRLLASRFVGTSVVVS